MEFKVGSKYKYITYDLGDSFIVKLVELYNDFLWFEVVAALKTDTYSLEGVTIRVGKDRACAYIFPLTEGDLVYEV